MNEKIELLREEVASLRSAASHLEYSLNRCQNLVNQVGWGIEELERLESLTSRFARLSDLMVQRIFRLIDEIELNGGGTVLDRLFRAEKSGWSDAR